jgi:hypothetical protein
MVPPVVLPVSKRFAVALGIDPPVLELEDGGGAAFPDGGAAPAFLAGTAAGFLGPAPFPPVPALEGAAAGPLDPEPFPPGWFFLSFPFFPFSSILLASQLV